MFRRRAGHGAVFEAMLNKLGTMLPMLQNQPLKAEHVQNCMLGNHNEFPCFFAWIRLSSGFHFEKEKKLVSSPCLPSRGGGGCLVFLWVATPHIGDIPPGELVPPDALISVVVLVKQKFG